MPEPRDAKTTAKKADEKKEVVVENNAPEKVGEEIVETFVPVDDSVKEANTIEETLDNSLSKQEVIAEVVAPKQKLYKVKFLENHEFCVGTEKHTTKKGDVLKVELHLANLFGQRKIAYMVE